MSVVAAIATAKPKMARSRNDLNWRTENSPLKNCIAPKTMLIVAAIGNQRVRQLHVSPPEWLLIELEMQLLLLRL